MHTNRRSKTNHSDSQPPWAPPPGGDPVVRALLARLNPRTRSAAASPVKSSNSADEVTSELPVHLL